jgi:hypothetical protein
MLSEVLRKALVVASKLQLEDMATCLRSELDGYDCAENGIPSYRQVGAVVKAPVCLSGLDDCPIGSTACEYRWGCYPPHL